MRIASDHSCSPAANTRSRVASPQTDKGFADTLASASQASDAETNTYAPELSAATYRLFAAVDLERGNTEDAARFLSRAVDAREPNLPLHPAGVLSESGRWDYTEAAAALPQTGHFDPASGQGTQAFAPYSMFAERPTTSDCNPSTPNATAPATTPDATDGTQRRRFATLGESTRLQAIHVSVQDGIDDLLDA